MNQARLLAGILALSCFSPQEAAAYIDPGTGSLIVQGLIAGAAAVAVALRTYWYRIKAFFRGERSPTDQTRDPPAPKQNGERE